MKQKTKDGILEWLYSAIQFILQWGVYTYLLYSFAFNFHHSAILAIILTIPTVMLEDILGYMKDMKDQRKELVDALSKIADKLNESKEVDERLCDALEKQNEREKLNDARKALNS